MMAADNPSLSWSNPFGYTFAAYPTNDPPSGPPLLDQDESTSLQNFFSDPDQFSANDMLPESMLSHLNSVPDSTFALLDPSSTDTPWLYPAPTQQSYYPPLEQAYQNQNQNQDTTYPQRSLQQQQQQEPKDAQDLLALVGIPANGTPADVLHAASTLFMYRTNPTQTQTPANQQPARNGSLHYAVPTPTSSSATSQYPAAPSATSQYPTTNTNTHAHSSASSTPMFHFGTDNNFRQSGYAAPYEGIEDQIAQPHLNFARNVVNSSNPAMSSVENSLPHTPDMGPNTFYPATTHALPNYANHHTSAEQQSNKRRKIMSADEQDYPQTSPTALHINNISSPDNTLAEDSDDHADIKRRRDSSATTTKQLNNIARKNLTEEQKRNNHIKSEQKRRNIIKQGYQDLNQLVPNLKTGGFSKSAVLTETTRFLEELVVANSSMEQHLRQLAAQRGLNFDDLFPS
jgi:hypothetical protein